MGATQVCATLIFLISITNYFQVSEAGGFSIDLIHRNSLQYSPNSLYSSASSEQVQTSLQRSFNRAKTLAHHHSVQSISTDIVSDGGEYLLRFSLGTPQTETLAIADTGSDLIWIQCKPCPVCFNQKSPLFDPSHSSTYKHVSCDSKTCDAFSRTSCNNATKNTCGYSVSYGDKSYSTGELATETIALESKKIRNVVIGCGHSNQGTFGAGASGIVGLGGGKMSLIRQLGSSIQGKFSYCLVPAFGSNNNPGPSKMHFGHHALVSGHGVVRTPIVEKSPDTFYFLTLEGMSVGGRRLDLDIHEYHDYGMEEVTTEGNIIIDSGTTLTFLPSDLYHKVEAQVKRHIKMKRIRDPAGILNLCYHVTAEGGSLNVPQITAHFKGADLKLKPANTFVMTTENSVCLAFAPATSLSIFGNLAQMDILVAYDLEKKTVSFKPTDCTKA